MIYLSWEKLLLLVVDCSCMCLLSVRCHTVFTLLIPLFQSRTHYSVHPQITRLIWSFRKLKDDNKQKTDIVHCDLTTENGGHTVSNLTSFPCLHIEEAYKDKLTQFPLNRSKLEPSTLYTHGWKRKGLSILIHN